MKKLLLLLLLPLTAFAQTTIDGLSPANPLTNADEFAVWQLQNTPQCANQGQCTYKTNVSAVATAAAALVGTSFSNLSVGPTGLIKAGSSQLSSQFAFLGNASLSGTPTSVNNSVAYWLGCSSDNQTAHTYLPGCAEINYSFGGAALTGGRAGLNVVSTFTAPSGNSGISFNPSYVGIGDTVYVNSGDGGSSGTPLGYFYGGNDSIVAGAGAAYVNGIFGREIDVACESGCTSFLKEGMKIVQTTADTTAGYGGEDMGLSFQNGNLPGTGTPGWNTVLAFGGPEGYSPVAPTGTLIGGVYHNFGSTKMAAGTGIDLTEFTFSGNAYASAGFSVDSAGDVTSNSLPVSILSKGADPLNIADSTAAIRAALATSNNGTLAEVDIPCGMFHVSGPLFVGGSGAQFMGGHGLCSTITVGPDFQSTQAASFTGVLSGTTLTVSGVTGTLAVGEQLQCTGCPSETFIASGSGTSWQIQTSAQTLTISSEAMTTRYGVINLVGTGNPNISPEVYNFRIAGVIPTGQTARSNFAALGTCTNTTGCIYPWFVQSLNAGVPRIRKMRLEGAWDGISLFNVAGSGVISGAWIQDIESEALDNSLYLDQIFDATHLDNFKVGTYSLKSTTTATDVFQDGNTYAAKIGRADGLQSTNFSSFYGRVQVLSDFTFGAFTNFELDTASDLSIDGTSISSVGLRVALGHLNGTPASGNCNITIANNAGDITFSSFEVGGSGTTVSDLCVTGTTGGGHISFDSHSSLATGSTTLPVILYQPNNGRLNLSDSRLSPPAAGTVAPIQGTGSAPTLRMSNIIYDNAQAGSVAAVTWPDNALNSIVNNTWNGWTFTPPGPAGSYGPNSQDWIYPEQGSLGLGFHALKSITSGTHNTGVGTAAGFKITSGSNITAVGQGALAADTTAGGSTAVGEASLNNATGAQNTAEGYQACNTVTTGGSNLCDGAQVGSTTLTTGSGNILIGTSSAVDTVAANTSQEINIGGAILGYAIAPTLTSGWGTSPTAPAQASTFSFSFTVGATGTSSATGVIGLPTSPATGWFCTVNDQTSAVTARQSANSATSSTVTWGTAPSNSDLILGRCTPY